MFAKSKVAMPNLLTRYTCPRSKLHAGQQKRPIDNRKKPKLQPQHTHSIVKRKVLHLEYGALGHVSDMSDACLQGQSWFGRKRFPSAASKNEKRRIAIATENAR